MLGVNDIITDVEAERLTSHCKPFHCGGESRRIRIAPKNDLRPWLLAYVEASLEFKGHSWIAAAP
jgi:hypothetical protein